MQEVTRLALAVSEGDLSQRLAVEARGDIKTLTDAINKSMDSLSALVRLAMKSSSEVGAAASQREVFRHNPHSLRGKTLYYSSAIGTERLIADVILDQVADFDKTHS